MVGLTLAGLAVTSIEESQDPKAAELLLRENTPWIQSFHKKMWARNEMFGSYTITDGDEQLEMSSEFPYAANWVSRSTSNLREVKKNYDAPKMKFIAPANGSSFPKPKIHSKLAGRFSSPETDSKDLLSHAPVSSPPSPPLPLASSSPSAKGKYIPPARRTGLGPSQPSSPSSLPSTSLSSSPSSLPLTSTSSSPSTSPSTSPSSSPTSSPTSSLSSSPSFWQSSPSAGSTGWRRNPVPVTSSDPDSFANAMTGAPTPGARLKKAVPCSNSWRDRSTESSSSRGGPMTACQRSCHARLQRQEHLRRRSS